MIAAIVLTSCGVDVPINNTQKEFEEKRSSFFELYDNAVNDIQRSGIWLETNDWTSDFSKQNNRQVKKWFAEVYSLSTSQGGDYLSVTLVSEKFNIDIEYKTWSNRFSDSDDNTMIRKGSDIYESFSSLKEGDIVCFSGRLIRDREKGIRESSLTEYGSLSNPEFVMKFTDVYVVID